MSQKDSSSKIKAQPGAGGGSTSSRKSGNTRYRMQAAMAQEETARAAAEQQAKLQAQRSKEQPLPEPPPQPEKSRPEGEGEISEDNVRGLWKSRVLASYKGKSPKDSHTLLAKIPEGKAVVQVSDHFKTTNIQEAMIVTVDRMFDVLQNCAYEFNKIAHGTELELNWIRPFLSKETTTTWHQNEGIILVFSGRMSTRRWTLVVKGTQEEIVIYILPTDKLIGFALSHKNFKPYLTLVPFAKELDVGWKIRNQVIEPESQQLVYKELFDALIRFAREEASLDEQFDLRAVGIEPGAEIKDEDAERQRFYQEQFFQDMRSRQDKQQDFAPAALNSFESDAPVAGSGAGTGSGAGAGSGSEFEFESEPEPGSSAYPGAYGDGMLRGGPRVPPPPPQPGVWKTSSSQPNQAHLHMPAMQPLNQTLQAPHTPPLPPLPLPAAPPPSPSSSHLPPLPMPPGSQQPLPPGSNSNFPPYPADPNIWTPHPGQIPPAAPQWPPSPAPQPQMPPPPQPPVPGYGQYPQSAAQQMSSQQHLHQIQSHQQQVPSDLQQMMPAPMAPSHGHSSPNHEVGSAHAPNNLYQQNPPLQQNAHFNEENLGDVLQALVACLDRELEVVAKAGADAFAQRDLNRADAALKFSERLTDFRSVAQELLSYYKDR